MKNIHHLNPPHYHIQPSYYHVQPPLQGFKKVQHVPIIQKPITRIQQSTHQIQKPVNRNSLFQLQDNEDTKRFTTSQMSLKLKQITNYQKLLNRYDRILAFDLLDQRILMNIVVLIQIQMQPQNMFWVFWRNSDQILEFLQDIQPQIEHLQALKQNGFKEDQQVISRYLYLVREWRIMNQNQQNRIYGTMDQKLINQLIQWLHLIGHHPYLRKNIEFLIFVSHCLPLDKWHIQVYQQIYVRKPYNLIDKFTHLVSDQKAKRKKDFFITITSDGILRSDSHLLLSKVDKMIPFTNLMQVQRERKDQDVIYRIKSGRTQHWQINFHDNYIDAINFACGLGRARIDAQYMASYLNVQKKFNQYSRQHFIKQEKQNVTSHRFKSFAPPRSNCAVKMYNDGCGYFQDMYSCIMNAKFQICITDWMLTPYFLLRRPGQIKENNPNRLDQVLGQAAQRGVKIFIILYMQPSMFINNDSEGAARTLQKMSKNIKVLRHPNSAVPIIWSHHQKLCVIDQKIGFMGGLDLCYGRWDTPQHKLVQSITDPSKRLWDGCDYNNFRTSDIYQPRKFDKSILNQDFQVRMPWHDIALQMRGDAVIDLLRHFVQYWYFVKQEYKFSFTKIINSFKSKQKTVKKRHIGKQIKQATEQLIQQKFENLVEDVSQQFFPGHQHRVSELLIQQRTGINAGNTNIQMLRSANNWSIGAQKTQMSIHNAYINLIRDAENHIYIENQFFMGLKNQIVQELCKRVQKAYNEKKPFKVVIVVPLLPGFEGDPGDPGATVLRIQVHYQKFAITLGDDSIYKRLELACPGINVSDYIYFFGLRKWDVLLGSPITEIIYVHSKLMIVDDKRAICGSANINDRSLTGQGDSQIAVCIQQTQQSGNHLFEFRCKLFEEHFAFTKQQTAQITNPQIWNKLLQRARTNTLIYREVFGCIPDDEVTTHQEIQILSSQATYNVSKLKGIIGHVVQYPLKFMDDEDLQFSMGQKQYYAPVQSFT